MDPAMRDLFGMSNDPAKSKNPSAQSAICLVRSAIETLNKSKQLSALFFETCMGEFGDNLRPENHALHRGGSNELVLEMALTAWDQMTAALSSRVVVLHLLNR